MAGDERTVLRLLLARHGETEWNAAGQYQGQANPPLNQRGRRQASCLAARVASRQIDAVYTSDLQRAKETAALMGKALIWYFMVDTGSLSELELYGDRPLLRRLNDTGHLKGCTNE